MRWVGLIGAGALAIGLSACGGSGGQSGADAKPDAAKAAILATLPAPYNTADLANGEKTFALCKACHTIIEGGPKLTGPNLHGVFGRTAGTSEGFAYSPALKGAGFAWDAAHLDQWLANPRTFLPGTKMSFEGVKDAKDRTDLIAYLKVESGYKPN